MNKTTPIILILPDIRSAMNIGAIFRTADALGIEEIILTGYSASPHHPKVAKTAIGAESTVKWRFVDNIKDEIHNLKCRGYSIIALEKTDKSTDLFKTNIDFPAVLMVGNEINGVQNELLDLSKSIVHLPMLGAKESLNVSTAMGIAGYEMLRKYNNKF